MANFLDSRFCGNDEKACGGLACLVVTTWAMPVHGNDRVVGFEVPKTYVRVLKTILLPILHGNVVVMMRQVERPP